MTTEQKTAILKWFTGKALKNAEEAVKLLETSEAQGFWVPKASRRVRATLDKSNVATKYIKNEGAVLNSVGNYDFGSPATLRGWYVQHYMGFGQFINIQKTDWDFLFSKTVSGSQQRAALEFARGYAADFAPVAALIAALDDTRPQPVFTSLGASPTVTTTLKSLGFDGAPGTTAVPCPVEWIQVERVDQKGRPYSTWKPNLLWPHGTRHDLSRYAAGSANNDTCHACGHAIKNPYNWVPVLIQSVADVPKSMWVGSDCAKRVFGISVSDKVEMRGEKSLDAGAGNL